MILVETLKEPSSGFIVGDSCVFGVELIKLTTAKAKHSSGTPPCPTLGPGMALCLSRAHRHGSPPWPCRPVAAREETRSSPSQAVSPRVTNTPSLSHSSAPLRLRMGVEASSCCAASQLGVLACLFRFQLDVEMRPTGGAGRVLCVRALVH